MSKDIQLCCLGNALVDLQYEVPEVLLEKLNIKKGQMKLVETGYQARIIEQLSSYRNYQSSGGSAANTIIAFSRFGGKAAYQSMLGNDVFGQFYSKEFADMGILLHADFLDSEPTGTCLVLITPDSERSMMTALGATAKFGTKHLNEKMIEDSEWIYIEGYYLTQENTAGAVSRAIDVAKSSSTKISATFSDVFITEYFHHNLNEVVKNCDLIFCNEIEASNFTKSDSIEKAAAILKELCPNYAITLGNKGSQVFWQGKEIFISPYPAEPVDSTGAGDMYAAGFLYGIITKNSPVFAGHLGSAAAAKVVSQFGARLNESHVSLKDKILESVYND